MSLVCEYGTDLVTHDDNFLYSLVSITLCKKSIKRPSNKIKQNDGPMKKRDITEIQ